MTDQVQVRGADELARTLSALASDLDDLTPTTRDAARIVVNAAQGYAPRRTGRLRASIAATTTREGATISAGVGIVRPYPSIQEYGSARRGITGSHYMRRAAEKTERDVVNQYDTDVQRAVNRVRGA